MHSAFSPLRQATKGPPAKGSIIKLQHPHKGPDFLLVKAAAEDHIVLEHLGAGAGVCDTLLRMRWPPDEDKDNIKVEIMGLIAPLGHTFLWEEELKIFQGIDPVNSKAHTVTSTGSGSTLELTPRAFAARLGPLSPVDRGGGH